MARIINFISKTINLQYSKEYFVLDNLFMGNNDWLVERQAGVLHLALGDHYPLSFAQERSSQKGTETTRFLQNTSDPLCFENRKMNWARFYIKTRLRIPKENSKIKTIKVELSMAISDFPNFTGFIYLPHYPINIKNWTPVHYIPDTYQQRISIPDNLDVNYDFAEELSSYKSLVPFYDRMSLPTWKVDYYPIKSYIKLFIHKQEILKIELPNLEEVRRRYNFEKYFGDDILY